MNSTNRDMGSVKMFDYYYETFKLALKGMNIGTGSYINDSGEKNVLDMVAMNPYFSEKRPPIIFDVGANIGDYTMEIIKAIPHANVHVFEASKHTFCRLQENLATYDAVLNNVAVGSECGEATLYYDRESSGLASLYKRQLDHFGIIMNQSETVSVTTIDAYCATNEIKHIDLLKMDIEGHEFAALKGANKMLDHKCIAAIQIEFGGCNIDSRTYFRDFWNLLHENYNVFRIMKDGFWPITKYTEKLEIFTTTNFLFLDKNIVI